MYIMFRTGSVGTADLKFEDELRHWINIFSTSALERRNAWLDGFFLNPLRIIWRRIGIGCRWRRFSEFGPPSGSMFGIRTSDLILLLRWRSWSVSVARFFCWGNNSASPVAGWSSAIWAPRYLKLRDVIQLVVDQGDDAFWIWVRWSEVDGETRRVGFVCRASRLMTAPWLSGYRHNSYRQGCLGPYVGCSAQPGLSLVSPKFVLEKPNSGFAVFVHEWAQGEVQV